jgi:hypothetical protein
MKYLKKYEGLFSDRYREEASEYDDTIYSSRLKEESEETETSKSDIDFIMSKIKEHFSQSSVTELFDSEILEWVDDDWEDGYDSEYDWYMEHNNGEAQDAVIHQMISWYKKEFNKNDSDIDWLELPDAIKSEYDCLSY